MVFSKKLEKTVKIGIITKSEIRKEDIYQKLILIIYNPPYKNEKYLCLRYEEGDILPNKRRHSEQIKN